MPPQMNSCWLNISDDRDAVAEKQQKKQPQKQIWLIIFSNLKQLFPKKRIFN